MIFSVIREFFLWIVYVFGGFVGCFFKLKKVNENVSIQTPIVFVHGWMTSSLPYFLLKRHLEERGFEVHMADFGLHSGNHLALAKKLEKFIRTRKLNNVVLVGASSGALVSLAYLKEEKWNHVKKFISIGGPFGGSPLAYLAAFSKAGRQMIPGSRFLKDLMKTPVKRTSIVCLSAQHDELVSEKSSRIPGTRHESLNITGHVYLEAFSKEMMNTVVQHALSD